MNAELSGFPEYSGPFRDLLPSYLLSRQAMGLKLDRRLACRLREVDNFFKDHGVTKPEISRELYDEFTSIRPGEKEGTTELRRSAIRPFARYLLALGYENIYTGADDKRIFRSNFIPYIFSSEEISRMFSALDEWHENNPNLEDDAFRMAMQLYYCCGFRRSEVQHLKKNDVNLSSGKITIRESKNRVSRIVVASDSLRLKLTEYTEYYLASIEEDDFFIYPSQKRKTVENKIYTKYARLLAMVGICTPEGSVPRLHDLRHTFCVRALEQMETKGFDLYTSLPMLSTYLGHRRITETEYYLRLMESHFSGILNKVEQYSPNLYKGIITDGEDGHD